ncbi:putative Fe-S cluster assembly protein SufT [Ramlibacter sp. USB13]|uniref:Fe-S cluster assembly protein SufT n=1 Tax=Ramlibacter cellulosilyticus TaxID=2764187 RepID=A0A923SCB0_9BURK|nr:putative Fe-S cluster assembly protein SufT [Ramlibacter cellulosilyticus]MBC5784704.1 putative Fe-S cluster assembly protein SufT [Ramlibacter cellulosilyticus]
MRPRREKVIFRRLAEVQRIPDGETFEVDPGTVAEIAQALGSHFTLVIHGQLARLTGSDADAIGKPVPAPHPLAEDVASDLTTRVWRTLATCYDPEIPVDIVDLGLVYACDVAPMDDGRARVAIRMTLTAPGCGMGDLLANEVADKVLGLDGVGEVKVDMVFDPPWDRSRMSEAAQLALGL